MARGLAESKTRPVTCVIAVCNLCDRDLSPVRPRSLTGATAVCKPFDRGL